MYAMMYCVLLLQAEVEARPLLYNNFMTVTADDNPVYNAVPGYDQLRKALNDKLTEYNESNAVMDLVLFQQAMEHICRITRIISQPRGNAMLVGVGGSGKQSLARSGSPCLHASVLLSVESCSTDLTKSHINMVTLL